MEQNQTLPDKKAVAETLLTKGNVFLHLDPRKEGVVVPEWLKDQLQLVLQIGHDLPIRIPDLDISDDGVSATLSFNRSPFTCWVPWESLFALVGENGRGMVWMSDMPSEIAAEIEREIRRSHAIDAPDAERTVHKRKRNGKDSGIKDNGEACESAPKAKPNAARTRKRRRVAGEKVHTETNATTTERESFVAVKEKKDHDESASPSCRTRKRRIRELPPYLRVIK